MGTRISQLAAAVNQGNALLELSQPSPTVTYAASTISASAATNSFHDAAGQFLAQGFAPDMAVRAIFQGVTPNSKQSRIITQVTATDMYFAGTDGDDIVNATAGSPVTLTAWESVQTSVRGLISYVRVEDFEANGVGDDTAEIQAAIDYCATLLGADATSNTSVLLTSDTDHSISAPLVFPNKSRFHVRFTGTLYVSAWSELTSVYAIQLNQQQSVISLGRLDCGYRCSGIMTDGFNLTLRDANVVHFRDVGVEFRNGGNTSYSDLMIQQWTQSDVEFGDDTKWTGIGLWCSNTNANIKGIDARFYNVSSAWSALPVKLDASGNMFFGCHFWHGRPDAVANGYTKPVDPVILESHSNNPNYFIGCYFDNGHVDVYGKGIVIDGGYYVNIAANVTLADPLIRVYRGAGVASDPQTTRIYGIRTSVGFFSGTGGAWDGDYTKINEWDEDNAVGTTTDINSGRTVIVPVDTNGRPTEQYMKPGGRHEFAYWTGTQRTRVFSEGADYTIAANRILFADEGLNTQWMIGDVGNFIPQADQTYDIGSTTLAVRLAYARGLAVRSAATAPTTKANHAQLWYDSTDGNLKVKFPNGANKLLMENAAIDAPIVTDGRSLSVWRGKAARLKNGVTSPTPILRFMAVGDSWAMQTNIMNGLRSLLNTEYGESSSGWISVASTVVPGITVSATGWTTYDANIDGAPLEGCSIDGKKISATGTTATLSVSGWDETDFVAYYRNTTGTFRWRIDGGAWTTVTGTGSNAVAKVTLTGLAASSHTFEVDLTGNTGTVAFYGFRAMNPATAGVEFQQCGNGGIDTSHLLTYLAEYDSFLTDLVPDVVLVIMGTNDSNRAAITTTIFESGITALVDKVRAFNPNVGVILLAPPDGNGDKLGPTLAELRNILYDIAKTKTCELYNLYDEFGPFTQMNSLLGSGNGVWNDNFHLNSSGGYHLNKRLMAKFLTL